MSDLVLMLWTLYSARSLTATPGGRRRNAMYDEDDDLTKDMDDPTPEPNIQETSLQRVVNVKSHRDADSQPIRGGTLLDIDEESDVRYTVTHLLCLFYYRLCERYLKFK